MVGHPGVAPGVSPIRTARIAVFLVPEKNWSAGWDLNPNRSRHKGRCCLYTTALFGIQHNWWSHGESHPDPRHAMTLSCC